VTTASISRRTVLATSASAAALGLLGGAPARAAAPVPDARRAAEVRAEFLHAWRGYTSHAWGRDEVRPVSGRPHDFFAPGRTLGLSIVEAVDTLHLMGEDHEVARCCDWIEQHFDVSQDAGVNVFESVIRLVGGLLAAHLATGRPALLKRCAELADRLLPAFTSSPTGIPYQRVNLASGHVSGRVVSLAQACSNAPEFGLLSRLTGDARYYDAASRAYRAVVSRVSALDLLGTSIDVETGRWADTTSWVPNPPVDSCYEYLWTAYALLGDRELLSWYRRLTAAVVRHQARTIGGRLWFVQVDSRTGRTTGYAQSELAAFYAGLLAKGGDLRHGAAYYRSWTDVLNRYSLLPETIDLRTLRATSPGNQLRPEYANAAFDLWRVTGSAYYQDTAWHWFTATRAHQRVPGGYTVATDVTGRGVRLGDLTPGYFFAENLKYLWLMYSATPRFDYRNGILSTEGKVLRGLRP
jgi:mannosyl-oligosaccharide alpha-1,2-mannosidase